MKQSFASAARLQGGGSPGSHPAAAAEIADPDLNHVTTSELTVDGEVEECSVSQPCFPLEPEPDGPNLLRFEGRLAPGFRPAFHGRRFLKPGS
jgi:hypothetical protein